ncbi:MAG: Kae1-associated kinase Bud32 [Thermoproteota archaeon]|nr:MAG: Kae1-associated kinase Bud32 [Candidatus Korarchaeota archaeon]RLG53435.1 MAG: Kae1-associated kinase Bud32 [Candidatus Korarchaeota archaeon]
MEKLIASGAEAKIYEIDFFGIPAVKKVRIKKDYRIPELDSLLRKRRTSKEAKALHRAKKFGVPCPSILDIHEYEIVMEKVDGITLRDLLVELRDEDLAMISNLLGVIVGRLHKAGLVHNDLTGVNFILMNQEKICLIDFGLVEFSEDCEDRAVDLHVFKQSIAAIDPKRLDFIMDRFIEGYSKEFGERAKEVLARLKSIERRGRYKTR